MLKRMIKNLKKGLKTSLRKRRQGSDYERWGTSENLSSKWDSRTEKIAKLVDAGTSVIEFGAARLVLKTHLPDCCTYTPSDLVDRGEGTIVCDLNSEMLPQLQHYNFAIFSGVLEYINDVPRLIAHLSNHVDAIVTSYAVTDLNKTKRRTKGWVNDFSAAQFVAIFEQAGIRCDHTEGWKSQLIYRFRKTASAKPSAGSSAPPSCGR